MIPWNFDEQLEELHHCLWGTVSFQAAYSPVGSITLWPHSRKQERMKDPLLLLLKSIILEDGPLLLPLLLRVPPHSLPMFFALGSPDSITPPWSQVTVACPEVPSKHEMNSSFTVSSLFHFPPIWCTDKPGGSGRDGRAHSAQTTSFSEPLE